MAQEKIPCPVCFGKYYPSRILMHKVGKHPEIFTENSNAKLAEAPTSIADFTPAEQTAFFKLKWQSGSDEDKAQLAEQWGIRLAAEPPAVKVAPVVKEEPAIVDTPPVRRIRFLVKAKV